MTSRRHGTKKLSGFLKALGNQENNGHGTAAETQMLKPKE